MPQALACQPQFPVSLSPTDFMVLCSGSVCLGMVTADAHNRLVHLISWMCNAYYHRVLKCLNALFRVLHASGLFPSMWLYMVPPFEASLEVDTFLFRPCLLGALPGFSPCFDRKHSAQACLFRLRKLHIRSKLKLLKLQH